MPTASQASARSRSRSRSQAAPDGPRISIIKPPSLTSRKHSRPSTTHDKFTRSFLSANPTSAEIPIASHAPSCHSSLPAHTCTCQPFISVVNEVAPTDIQDEVEASHGKLKETEIAYQFNSSGFYTELLSHLQQTQYTLNQVTTKLAPWTPDVTVEYHIDTRPTSHTQVQARVHTQIHPQPQPQPQPQALSQPPTQSQASALTAPSTSVSPQPYPIITTPGGPVLRTPTPSLPTTASTMATTTSSATASTTTPSASSTSSWSVPTISSLSPSFPAACALVDPRTESLYGVDAEPLIRTCNTNTIISPPQSTRVTFHHAGPIQHISVEKDNGTTTFTSEMTEPSASAPEQPSPPSPSPPDEALSSDWYPRVSASLSTTSARIMNAVMRSVMAQTTINLTSEPFRVKAYA